MKNFTKQLLIPALFCLQLLSVHAQDNSCLVGHYTMSGNANDKSNSENHCTVSGATLTTDRFGNNNTAYYFNGNAKLYAPIDTRTFEGMSVTAWIKTSYTSKQATIVQIAGPVLYTNRFSQHKFFSSLDGTTQNNFASQECTTDVTEGEWIFVSAVCDGSTTKLYVNGLMESSYSESLYKANGQMTIGMQDNNMWGFVGSIDEVRLYSCALTGLDIKDIYDDERKKPAGLTNGIMPAKETIKLYPNPTEDRINIDFNIENVFELQITDLTGKVINLQPVHKSNKNNLSVDISTYKPGIYFVQIFSSNGIYSKKLLVK